MVMINDSDLICGIFLHKIICYFVIMWLTCQEGKWFKLEASSYRIKKMSGTFQINLLAIVNFGCQLWIPFNLELYWGKGVHLFATKILD